MIIPITLVQAIDVHAHFGKYSNRPNAQLNGFMSGDAEVILQRARMAGTELSIVSPLQALTPRGHNDPVTGNRSAADVVSKNQGLLQWVVIDPLKPETFEQAASMLANPRCVGIKIHPEEHCYSIREQGRVLFEFAARHQAVILTHSGEGNSMPEDFVPFADDFPEVRLILAHLGCGHDGDPTHQVRAIQAGKQGNIFVDTSSAQSLMPHLIEWAVAEVGAERILYGTDSPLYFAPMQRARIDHAEISENDKRCILRSNAMRLLDLKGVTSL